MRENHQRFTITYDPGVSGGDPGRQLRGAARSTGEQVKDFIQIQVSAFSADQPF